RERKLLRQTLPNGIMPLRDNMKAAGFAFTIKGAKNLTLKNEMASRAEMLDAITENSFVVWDTSLDLESAHCGECMTMAPQRAKTHAARQVVASRAQMRDAITENSFVVWATSLDLESAHSGDCMTLAAQRKKCRGAAVDGGVRDTDRVLELGFPRCIRYRSP